MIARLRGRLFRRRSLDGYPARWLGVACIVIAASVLLAIVGTRSLHLGETRYRVEFAQAAQLRAGDPVTIAGVEVGTVEKLWLDGDRVQVSMMLDNGVSLGSDTSAAIKLTTLLGRRYVELRPAGDSRAPDNVITIAHTSVPYDLQALLSDVTTTFEQIDAEQMGNAITELSRQLDGAPSVIPQAMANIQAVSSIVAARRDQIGAVLENTAKLAEVLRNQQASLGQLVTDGRTLLQELLSRDDLLQRLLAATSHLATQLQAVVVGERPGVDKLIANLNELTEMLGRHDDLVRNTLQILPVPVRNYANATGSSNAVDFNAPAGPLIDSWMCALGGRGPQFNLPEYFKDCK